MASITYLNIQNWVHNTVWFSDLFQTENEVLPCGSITTAVKNINA
jgi:hypothetical protein